MIFIFLKKKFYSGLSIFLVFLFLCFILSIDVVFFSANVDMFEKGILSFSSYNISLKMY